MQYDSLLYLLRIRSKQLMILTRHTLYNSTVIIKMAPSTLKPNRELDGPTNSANIWGGGGRPYNDENRVLYRHHNGSACRRFRGAFIRAYRGTSSTLCHKTQNTHTHTHSTCTLTITVIHFVSYVVYIAGTIRCCKHTKRAESIYTVRRQ